MALTGIRHLYPAAGLIIAVTFGAACSSRQGQQPMAQAVPVQLQQVQPGSFQDSSDFVGTLEAQDRVSLRPETDGRITQLFVAPGDPVNAGDPIVQLDPEQVRARVSGAQAGADAARANREAATAQLEAAQAEQLQAESDISLAQTEFNRTERLVEKGALSAQDLDRARNQLEVATARLQQATKRVSAAESQLEQATSTLDQAQSEVAVSREDLDYKQVKAPISGVLGDVLFKVGDYIERGDTLTSITQNEFLFLRIEVPSPRSSQLRIGLPVELVDANTGNRLESGSISFISPEVDPEAQSILVKARFPNRRGRLREGQFVRARIIWQTTTELLVPTVAVTRLGGQSFVYVADETPAEEGASTQIVTQRPVQLGEIQGNSYQVLDGLEAGESIAISNILKLQVGVPIQTAPPNDVTDS